MARISIDDELNQTQDNRVENTKIVLSEEEQSRVDALLIDAVVSYRGEEAIEKAIEALSQGANLNAKMGHLGPNILFLATSNRDDVFFNWVLNVTQAGKKIDVSYTDFHDKSFLTAVLKEKISAYNLDLLLSNLEVDLTTVDVDGKSPLFQALFENNADIVKVLLKAGANPNEKLRRGNITPLLFAASECFDDIVIPLIEAGADVSVKDPDGYNALMLALMREPLTLPKSKRDGLFRTIEFLMNHPGVDVNIEANSGARPIFHTMRRDNYLPLFKTLLKRGVDVNVLYRDGDAGNGFETPLHYAAKLGNIGFIKPLIEAGAKLSIENKYGNSPESYMLLDENIRKEILPALESGDLKINPNAVFGEADKNNQFDAQAIKKDTVLKLLIYDLAFSEVQDMEDVANKEILQKVVKFLLNNGVDLTLKDKPELHSSEPLFVAMTVGNKSFISEVLNVGKNVIDFQARFNIGDKYTPNEHNYFSFLMTEANDKIAKKINENMKYSLADIRKNVFKKARTGSKSSDEIKAEKEEFKNATNELKKSADLEKENLMRNRVEIFSMLVDAGADFNAPLNDLGQNALFKVKDGFWIKKLNELGFDVYPKDNNGYTPLDLAIIKNDRAIIDAYKEIGPIPENTLYKIAFYDFSEKTETIKNSAKLGMAYSFYSEEEYKNFNKDYLTHVFSDSKYAKYIDEDGNDPLLVAASNGSEFLSTFFMQMGCDVNIQNSDGQTALQYACFNGLERLALKLLESGADPYVANADGVNALDIAKGSDLKSFVSSVENSSKNKSGLKIR